jgi:hypothetical protein
MEMNNRVHEKQLVELLAANTERLLKREKPAEAEITILAREASGSWNMVEKLAEMVPASQPDAELRNRIRAKLNGQWNVSGPGANPKRTVSKFFNNKRGMAFAWGAISIAVIVVTGFLATPAIIPAQSGAADFHPAAIAGGLIILGLIAIAYWRLNRKP